MGTVNEMELYDISQEVFSGRVFPGDPVPEKHTLLSMHEGAVCNLTAFQMCAHNGTHVDAPYHFYKDGEAIDQVSLDRFIGYAYVAEHTGELTAEAAESILYAAKACQPESAERILIKGKTTVTEEAARVFAGEKIKLLGVESQTVGPEDSPKEVHLIMLGAGIILLEGINLSQVTAGAYILNAAPINLGGSDGAPCRATLIKW